MDFLVSKFDAARYNQGTVVGEYCASCIEPPCDFPLLSNERVEPESSVLHDSKRSRCRDFPRIASAGVGADTAGGSTTLRIHARSS